jgi:hypothetical protein
MKKNFALIGLLVALLGLTWLITESGLLDSRPSLEVVLQKALVNPQEMELPMALLKVEQGVWRTGGGEIARAEILDEWHNSLLGIQVARTIEHVESRKAFFSQDLRFRIDDAVFEFGDLVPTGDAFYLGVVGDPHVYVVDLTQMGSLAVADEQGVLQQAKYQRLRDMLLFPEDGWRDTRLMALLQLNHFASWDRGHKVYEAKVLGALPWGKVVLDGMSANLRSLVVRGSIMAEEPKLKVIGAPWRFVLNDGSSMTWKFYQHPSLDLVYVWVPERGKAYPLDEESSFHVKKFPAPLIGRMFNMTFNPEVLPVAFSVKGKPVSNARSREVENFLKTEQTFLELHLVDDKCEMQAGKAKFVSQIGSLNYAWVRHEKEWRIFECAQGVEWRWKVPLDSGLDFATL